MNKQEAFRMLPAVHRVLDDSASASLAHFSSALRAMAVGQVLADLRIAWETGTVTAESWHHEVQPTAIVNRAAAWLSAALQPSLRKVLNLTGVVLHTNLGRAPLSSRAMAAVTDVAKGYSNLEFDLESGSRSSRHAHIEQRLCQLTGAEAAMVVNNNAAAVFLVLRGLAGGGEGIVSRGELVEIGGSFRVPDIMTESGVKLVEVGTTNKTRVADYEHAICSETRVLMRVHTSNFRIIGFTEQPSLTDLAALAQYHGILFYEDLGSGALFDFARRGIGDEPIVAANIRAGVDVVTFSGDKLLGGAQAGIIVGRKDIIEQLKRHPLARVLRVDKMTLAALEATLIDYADDETAMREVPVVQMLTASAEEVKNRAELLLTRLLEAGVPWLIDIIPEFSRIGGGALPTETIPTYVIRVSVRGGEKMSCDHLLEGLRRVASIPIVGRIADDAVLLDIRTLMVGEEASFIVAIGEVAMWWMSGGVVI